MFYVGQLVLCVDDGPSSKYHQPGYSYVDRELGGLKRGQVYTIRDAGTYPDGQPVVWLNEIVRVFAVAIGRDAPFAASRFRPLKDSALDVFTALLEPAPKETEPA